MSENTNKPAFITFTGVDRADLLPGMQALSSRFPIEWGVLIDPDRDNQPLYPDRGARQAFQSSALRLSAHICGPAASSLARGLDPQLELKGFARLQINHSRNGSDEATIQNVHAFGSRCNIRVALQCQRAFPTDDRVDWLYDVSFGSGKMPDTWPAVVSAHPLCGYSGGLGPANVVDRLKRFPVVPGVPFWIDMESGVRTAGRFDLEKCAAVCEAVFGG